MGKRLNELSSLLEISGNELLVIQKNNNQLQNVTFNVINNAILNNMRTEFVTNSILETLIENKSDVGHTHDERYYTKEEVDRLLANFVSKDVVAQMIQEALDNYNNPETPDTPVEPEVPIENIGSIAEDNSIIIDETQLENGVYTLKYIDSNNNIISNFNDITTFEINN